MCQPGRGNGCRGGLKADLPPDSSTIFLAIARPSPLSRSSRQPDPGASTLGPGRLTPDLLFTGCLETHNRHPPKTSEHLMTQSNSQSKGAQNTLTKIMLDDVAGVSDLRLCDRSVHSDSNGRGRGQGAAGTSHRDHVAPNSRAGIGWRRDRIGCLLCSAASHDYCSERTEQQQTKQGLCSARA